MIYVDKFLQFGEMPTIKVQGKDMTSELTKQMKDKGIYSNIKVDEPKGANKSAP